MDVDDVVRELETSSWRNGSMLLETMSKGRKENEQEGFILVLC